MLVNNEKIAIVGGNGFVGRHLTAKLVEQGYQVSVLTRRRESSRSMWVLPGVEWVECNVYEEGVISEIFANHQAVVNLVGILYEKKDNGKGFHRAHVELPRIIVNACLRAGVSRLLHMSALHADAQQSPSYYLKSKGQGEDLVHRASSEGLAVTSFRPSVIFGENDAFFNRFSHLLKLAPLVFPLACPHSKFSPVYVGDVVHAFVAALKIPETIGQRYDLCGPKIYQLYDLVTYVMTLTGHRRLIINLPNVMARIQAWLLEFVPGKPFCRDNYRSLQIDSVCKQAFPAVFNLKPAAIESVVPQYLRCQTQHGRFDDYRRDVHRD